MSFIGVLGVLMLASATALAQDAVGTVLNPTPAVEITESGLSTGLLAGWALIGVAAIATGVFILSRKFCTLGGTTAPSASPELALPLLAAALAIWMAQQIASGLGITLFGIDADARQTLTGMAALIACGLAGAGLAIAALTLTIPPITRAIAPPKPFAPSIAKGLGYFMLVFPLILVAGGLATGIESWLASRRGDVGPSAIAHETLAMLTAPDAIFTAPWWAVVLLVVLGVAIVEELIFRACLQGALRSTFAASKTGSQESRARWLAIIITSVLFVSVHAPVTPWYGLVPLFALSLGLGAAYERTGTILAPIIMHGVFNAVNVVAAVWTT